MWTLRRLLAGLVAIALLIAVISYLLREPHGGVGPTARPPGQPKLYPSFSYTDFPQTLEWAKGVNHAIAMDSLEFSGNHIREKEFRQILLDQWRQHLGKHVSWAMRVGQVTDTDVSVQSWFCLTDKEAKESRLGRGENYCQVLQLPLGQTEVTPYPGEGSEYFHYRYNKLRIGPQVNAHIARNLTSNGTVLLDAVIQDMRFYGHRTVYIILRDAKTPTQR
jgi:hypothetical protein